MLWSTRENLLGRNEMTTKPLNLYRQCIPVVDAQYNRDGDRTLAVALIDAIATAENVDPTELPPLTEKVDLDALTQLLDTDSGTADKMATFGFQYRSWNIFVRADGHIQVCDSTKSTDPEPIFA